jgi:hypothetical protein
MTEFMADDDTAMNRINPYTATATFGISYNGGYKGPNTQTWYAPEDKPASWDVPAEKPEYLDHFGPNQLNKSGSMYLKTGGIHPATSFMFPARKIQHDDGTATFSRETVWRNGDNYVSGLPTGFDLPRGMMWPILLIIALLVLAFVHRKKLGA